MSAGYYELVCKNIVIQAIRDLSSTDAKTVEDAEEYIRSELFEEHCYEANLPRGLRQALTEAAAFSTVPRRYVVRQIMAEIRGVKKAPGVSRGQKT